ncbi:MAG: hypothetical protein NC429_03010 [Lachnospiraceae bacterium]|nr:hypothetical protein [Lachnospiraceae bacterium]
MKKIIYKSKAIEFIILMITVVILVSLWPVRLFHETVTASIPPVSGSVTEPVDDNHTILQSFAAQYDHMDTVRLYLREGTEGESFFVRLFDEGQVMIAEEEVSLSDVEIPGYVTVLIDVDMEVGKMYHLSIQGDKSTVFLACELIPMTEMPYAGLMYYADSSIEGMNLAADYNYGVPLRKGKTAVFGMLTVLLAGLLLAGCRWYYRRKDRDKLITVERAVKAVGNPLTAVFTLFCLGAILLGACSKHTLDNTFFFISVLLLAAVLFYGINHNRDGQASVVTMEYLKNHIQDLIQSVCIAGAVGGCCEYMAGLYDIHHAMAERKEMIWFALAVIAMFRWKEIFNWYNLIYVIIAGIAGSFYYRNEVALLAEKTIKESEIGWNVQVIRHTVIIAVLLGLIVIRTVIGLIRKKLSRPHFVYAGLLLFFFAAIIVFRNGRWWTVVMAVSFTLFYLTYGMWEHKERLLVNVCRGVILQFLLATGYALLHRPYTTYRTARYPHIFHTVTTTAAYLTTIECAALVILLSKMRKSRELRAIWKELVLFGVVSAYMLFTMARTGFFAVGTAVLFAVVLMSDGKGRKKLLNMGRYLLAMIAAVVICFPITFTVQRTVPALVSDPYMYEFENFRDDTLRGRKLNSVDFMRVGRFIQLFGEKIFGIPEGTFDPYGEIEEYQRTHDEFGNEINTADRMPDIRGLAALGELIASADYVPDEQEEMDYTNGRLDIFRSYIEQLNMTGHEEMGAVLANGEIATHAHNIFLQTAYDHGIPVGILFALVGIATFAVSCIYYHKKKDIITYAAMPAVITVSFAVAGMVEWIFHLSHPCGLVLLLVITPLVFREGR